MARTAIAGPAVGIVVHPWEWYNKAHRSCGTKEREG